MMQATAPVCYFLPFEVCFEPAIESTSPSLFGFGEFLAILALLFIVLTLSDFRYRFRLIITRVDTKRVAFLSSFTIGASVLLIDVWFYNGWLIPVRLNDQNNLKAFFAFIFLLLFFYLSYRAFIRPPVFQPRNAKQYFSALHHFVGTGNSEELAVIASELGYSAKNIIDLASQSGRSERYQNKKILPDQIAYAHDTLLLLGSRKFCEVMVAKSPWTVAQFFRSAAECGVENLPIRQFCCNVGGEMVGNLDSSLHSEDEGYHSGYFGYTKPISKAVFGDYWLVESLASRHGSPLDLPFETKWEFKAPNLKAYARASLIFCESYFSQEFRRTHSVAFSQMLHVFERATDGLYRLKDVGSDYWRADEAQRLDVTVDFIRDVINLLDEQKITHRGQLTLPEKPTAQPGVHNQIAKLIFEVILDASTVTEPDWTCWSIQHNAVWSNLFHTYDSENWKVIRFKVRRLLYDEIKRMDDFPNFKGAMILGYCLNVLGLSENRSRGYDQESNPLRLAAVAWAKRNYLAVVEESPKVAKACLHGKMVFDAEAKQIVKFYGSDIDKEPKKSVLDLLEPPVSTVKKWES